jgi:hypothetical protein
MADPKGGHATPAKSLIDAANPGFGEQAPAASSSSFTVNYSK